MKKKVELENPSFVEEIPSSLVDPDDFYKMQKSKKRRILLIIIFFLFLLLVTGFFYGYLYKSSGFGSRSETDNDLIVIHSKTEFGDSVPIETYKSYSNAYSYHFYLENKEKSEIPYMIYLESYNSNVDLSKVHYAIVKDEKILFQGTINEENLKMVANKISTDSIHHYSLKLWSPDAVGNLSFKIKVEVS